MAGNDWMMMHSGRHVYPLWMTIDDILIGDITHHLGMVRRYSGAGEYDYTVAEHSCQIAWALRRDGYSPMVQLEGLLHDAQETWPPGDLIRPYKNALRAEHPEIALWLERNEEHISQLVAKKFNLPWPFDSIVKEYDSRIVNDEKAVLFKDKDQWDHGGVPLGVGIRCMGSAEAKKQMRGTFDRLWVELGHDIKDHEGK
jgi:hypothetical protein